MLECWERPLYQVYDGDNEYSIEEKHLEVTEAEAKGWEKWLRDNATVIYPKQECGRQHAMYRETRCTNLNAGILTEIFEDHVLIIPTIHKLEPADEEPSSFPGTEIVQPKAYKLFIVSRRIVMLHADEEQIRSGITEEIAGLFYDYLEYKKKQNLRGFNTQGKL